MYACFLRVVVIILICRCTSSAAILSCERVPLQMTCAAYARNPAKQQQKIERQSEAG
jgi:hypothetical protein